MKRKTDRRSLKTQASIKKALSSLLKEKPIKDITVTELTECADIHRATFYSHYEDIFDLYRDFENDIFKDLTIIFENQALTSYQKFYSAILDYVHQNPMLTNAVLVNFESSHSVLFKDLVEYLIAACKEAWKAENNLTKLTPQMEYFAQYRVHGIIAIIEHWIFSNCAMPLEEIKKMIAGLDKNVDSYMIKYSGN